MRIFFDTLGCAKNLVDTSKMEKCLTDAGIHTTKDASRADVIVLNTCAFIEPATQESIDTFFEHHNTYEDTPIIVAGCLVSRFGKDLKKALPEADGYLSCDEEDEIVKLVKSFIIDSEPVKSKPRTEKSAFSYVKISEGCNRKCSYCTIPYIRGKYKSSGFEEILNDVSDAVNKGAKEIVLVAQDCGVWGCDLKGKTLAQLLNKICPAYPDIYFRLLYVYPEAISDELINCFKTNKNLRRYIDMPVQHASEPILKSMGRQGSGKEYLELIKRLRKEIPDITLRSTIIVGFPGESDENFEELKDFVKQASFDYLGCFEYSREERTKAAEMKDQILDGVKHSRANEIRDIADAISLDKLHEKVGQVFEVLIEGKEEGRYFGRAQFQAPDVDGYVFISEFDEKLVKPGQLVNVKIQDQEGYDLVGSVND